MKKIIFDNRIRRGHADARRPTPSGRTPRIPCHRRIVGKIPYRACATPRSWGVYGVEFDVNMTADDSLIVYHGPKILDTKFHAQKNRFAEIRAVKLPGGLEIPYPPGVLRTGTERPVDQTDPRNQETRDAATRDAGRGGDPPSGARNAARAADRIHLVQPARLRRSAPPATRRRRRLRQQRHGGYESRRSEKSGGYGGLSYQLNVLMNRPELVDEANRLGIATTLWMVNDCELIDWAARHGITYVSTDCPGQGRSLSGSRRSLQEQEIIRLPLFRATHRQFASGGRNGTSCNLRTEQMISPPTSSIDRESDCGVKSQTSHKTQCRKDSKRIILKTKTNVFVTPRAEPDPSD